MAAPRRKKPAKAPGKKPKRARGTGLLRSLAQYVKKKASSLVKRRKKRGKKKPPAGAKPTP
jgi:hypothetical protein